MINTEHPLYEQYKYTLEIAAIAYRGKQAFYPDFGYRNNAINQLYDIFLPRHESEEQGKYLKRLKRSRFKKLFASTVDGMAGLLSQFTIKPDTLAWYNEERRSEILNNIDLQGSSLQQFKKECDIACLRDGFCAILVDYPRVSGASSRPYLVKIERGDIINWSYIFDEDGQFKLDWLIFQRSIYRQKGDSYESELVEQLIKIDSTAISTYEKIDGQFQLENVAEYTLPVIPIVFYPYGTGNPFEKDLPLWEVVEANVEHFQLYSEYRDSLYYQSPLYVRTGYDTGNVTERPLIVSPHKVIDLKQDATLQILETNGDIINLKKEAYLDIEKEIMRFSLEFLGEQSMTATEANLRSSSAKSNLNSYATDIMSSINEVFTLWAMWEGKKSADQGIDIKQEYWSGISPEMVRILMDLFTLGALDIESFWTIIAASNTLPSIDIQSILEKAAYKPQSL